MEYYHGKIKIGIVGCGAIARQQHLPALIQHPWAKPVALVDTDNKSAEFLTKLFQLNIPVHSKLDDIDKWDAAIVCVPPHLHAPISLELFDKNIHVLCEKPISTSIQDAETMIARAAEKKLIFAVVMQKFFSPNTGLLKKYLESDHLGTINHISLECRQKSQWNARNPERFSPKHVPGGVTFENGIHWLYRMAYWFGQPSITKYEDDRIDGVEANAVIAGSYSNYGQTIPFNMVFSADHAGKNRLVLSTQSGDVIVDDGKPDSIELHQEIDGFKIINSSQPMTIQKAPSLAYKQLDNFLKMIIGKEEVANPTCYSVAGLSFLLDCYASRQKLSQPWSE